MKYENSTEFGNKAANVGGDDMVVRRKRRGRLFEPALRSFPAAASGNHVLPARLGAAPPAPTLPRCGGFMSPGPVTPTFPSRVSGTGLNASRAGCDGEQQGALSGFDFSELGELLGQADLCAFPWEDRPVHKRKLKRDGFLPVPIYNDKKYGCKRNPSEN